MTKLTLAEWAVEQFKTPPSPNTLRKWAREGRIFPVPIKHGRSYYVDPNAFYRAPAKVARGGSVANLVDRIKADRERLGL